MVQPNIGPQQRAFRFKAGVVTGLATVALGALLVVLQWSPLWMALLIMPAFISALCFLQAAQGT